MKPRHKRFVLIGLGLIALAVASMLVLNAFQSNLVFLLRRLRWRTPKCRKGAASVSAGWSRTAASRARAMG